MQHLSNSAADPNHLIAGIDEAGRGPLAGPVVAAAVILDSANPIEGLADSKTLSEKQRLALYQLIQEKALAWSIATADVSEIDRLNILQATMLAMQRAVEQLSISPDLALVDGNKLPNLTVPAQAIVKGDQKIPAISAASILAKVHRDQLMQQYADMFPHFAFAQHKGYGTRQHIAELTRFGPSSIHRRSFMPVKKMLPQNT